MPQQEQESSKQVSQRIKKPQQITKRTQQIHDPRQSALSQIAPGQGAPRQKSRPTSFKGQEMLRHRIVRLHDVGLKRQTTNGRTTGNVLGGKHDLGETGGANAMGKRDGQMRWAN